jgi:hypothetical protein
MTGVRSQGVGVGAKRRLGRERDDGMRWVGRITRLALAASVALAALFSVLADVAFPGRSSSSEGRRPAQAAVGTDPSVRVALPPRNGGDTLTPPAVAPAPATGGGGGSVATSGGS